MVAGKTEPVGAKRSLWGPDGGAESSGDDEDMVPLMRLGDFLRDRAAGLILEPAEPEDDLGDVEGFAALYIQFYVRYSVWYSGNQNNSIIMCVGHVWCSTKTYG